MNYFHDFFPELSPLETLAITASQEPDFPDGDYVFLESYCTNPDCHCQEVVIHVVLFQEDWKTNPKQAGTPMASLRYSWNEPLSTHNPDLHPDETKTTLTLAIQKLLREHLGSDASYGERLSEHYKMIRKEAHSMSLTKTIHKEIQTGRNDPCFCGSGKKFKKCCLKAG